MDADTSGSAAVTDDSGRRRRVHGMLKLYYGLNEEGKADEQPRSLDPCDINGPHFDPELYLNKVSNLWYYPCLRVNKQKTCPYMLFDELKC